MQAVTLESFSGPAGLRVVELVVPQRTSDKLLIDVKATGVCYADLLTTYDRYQRRHPLPFTVGCELAGTVVDAPPKSTFVPGDRVLSIGQVGGFAEYCLVDPGWTSHIPNELSFAEACALPNYQTIEFALAYRCRPPTGGRVLVLGAGGGLGSAAVDLCVQDGYEVVAVARRAEAHAPLIELGAVQVLDLLETEATDIPPVDMIIDPVGGDVFDLALRHLRASGQYLSLGFASGSIPSVKLNKLLLRNISVVGAAWGEYLQVFPESLADVSAKLEQRVSLGWRPKLGRRYAGLEHTAAAFERLDTGANIGKQVVEQHV